VRRKDRGPDAIDEEIGTRASVFGADVAECHHFTEGR